MEPLEKVSVVHRRTPDGMSFAVDGATGGITPRGGFMLEFFVERPPLPISADIVRDQDGIIQKQSVAHEPSWVREGVCSLYMTPRTVVELATWLQEHVERMIETGLIKVKEEEP